MKKWNQNFIITLEVDSKAFKNFSQILRVYYFKLIKTIDNIYSIDNTLLSGLATCCITSFVYASY